MKTLLVGMVLVAGTLAGCGHGRREARAWSYVERKLSLTPEQKPLWEDFRREAHLAGEALEGEKRQARRALAAALGDESFDKDKVVASLDGAYDGARSRVLRVAAAWEKLHGSLSSEQKRRVRELAARSGESRRRGGWR